MKEKGKFDPALIQSCMRQLGFSEQSASLYVYLLQNGACSRSQLFDRMPLKDDDLDVLVDSRLINKRFDRGRIGYYPANAATWRAHKYDLEWGTNGPGPIYVAPHASPLEKRIQLCAQTVEELDIQVPAYKAVREHKHWDAMSNEEFSQLICEGILESRGEILAVSRSPRLKQVAPFWAALTARMAQGVAYHRITDLEEVVDHGLEIVERDIGLGIDLRILEADRLRHKFYIIDKSLLALFHDTDPQRGVGRITSQWQLIKRYREHFQKYARAAIPARTVLGVLARAADRLLEQARATFAPGEVEWLESLIRMGKFSQYHVENQWDALRVQELKDKAVRQRFIRLNYFGEPVPCYGVTDGALREEYEAS